jgi:hypothetical protein
MTNAGIQILELELQLQMARRRFAQYARRAKRHGVPVSVVLMVTEFGHDHLAIDAHVARWLPTITRVTPGLATPVDELLRVALTHLFLHGEGPPATELRTVMEMLADSHAQDGLYDRATLLKQLGSAVVDAGDFACACPNAPIRWWPRFAPASLVAQIARLERRRLSTTP